MSAIESVVDLLAKLVSFPSFSGQEGPVVRWLADYLAEHGLQPEITGRNLHVELGRGDGPSLLLNTHLDVVPTGEGWLADPFTPRLINGAMVGRGANDAKGCAAAMVMACLQLSKEDLPGKVILALTCDEETGGDGLEKLIHQLPHHDAAIVGEPTFNRPSLGMRGLVSCRLLARGRGCHASRPHEGINPLYALARDILAIEGFQPAGVDEILGKGTLAVTVFQGGSMNARNRVPDEAEAIIDMRTTSVWDNAKAIADLQQVVQHSEVQVRSSRIRPKSTSATERIASIALAVTGGPFYEFRGAADFAYVTAPGVILGPGNTSSHQPEEHIPLDSLQKAVGQYAEIARQFLKSA